jgi:leucyl/phenylalanyl-tRNA--protein transferase
MSTVVWLGESDTPDAFPPVEQALKEPDGLLAAGGDLSPERLLAAYRRGIFPWYSRGQPILWWSPDPRAVLSPREMKVSRRRCVTLGSKFDSILCLAR